MSAADGLSTDRRGFVGALAAIGGGAVLHGHSHVEELLAARRITAANPASDEWLDRLKGKYKQLLDAPDPDGGTILRHAKNYLDTWREAYDVPDHDVSVIVTFYAKTTPLGVQDAMWAKYKLGEAINLTEPGSSTPLVRNYFAHPQPGDPVGDNTPECSMEALMRRGVLFALCNNAVKRWSIRLEKAGLGKASEIHDDLAAHTVPGVVLVPDALIAMTKAHDRGFAYARS